MHRSLDVTIKVGRGRAIQRILFKGVMEFEDNPRHIQVFYMALYGIHSGSHAAYGCGSS
jgi:hypothetical protein